MWISLFATLAVRAVVALGLLIMTQAISSEELWQGFARGLLLVVFVLVGVWVFKALMLPILICVLLLLRHAMVWALLIVLALIAFTLLMRMLASRVVKRIDRHRSNKEKA